MEHAGLTKYNPEIHKGEYAKIVLSDAQGDWVYNVGDYSTQKAHDTYNRSKGLDVPKRFLQSIGFSDAVTLEMSDGYTADCGIIGVAFSDNHIIAMLDDNRIRYIIPYHSSSLPAFIKDITNINDIDYTATQNIIGINGIDGSATLYDLSNIKTKKITEASLSSPANSRTSRQHTSVINNITSNTIKKQYV